MSLKHQCQIYLQTPPVLMPEQMLDVLRHARGRYGSTLHYLAETAQALARLQEQAFQSDDRFADLLVRSRVSQGQGPRRILAELRTHGIADTEAREALEREGTDWQVLARQIYRRRFPAAVADGDRRESARRAAFLLRRGFDAATVRTITHADDVDDSAEEFD